MPSGGRCNTPVRPVYRWQEWASSRVLSWVNVAWWAQAESGAHRPSTSPRGLSKRCWLPWSPTAMKRSSGDSAMCSRGCACGSCASGCSGASAASSLSALGYSCCAASGVSRYTPVASRHRTRKPSLKGRISSHPAVPGLAALAWWGRCKRVITGPSQPAWVVTW